MYYLCIMNEYQNSGGKCSSVVLFRIFMWHENSNIKSESLYFCMFTGLPGLYTILYK